MSIFHQTLRERRFEDVHLNTIDKSFDLNGGHTECHGDIFYVVNSNVIVFLIGIKSVTVTEYTVTIETKDYAIYNLWELPELLGID